MFPTPVPTAVRFLSGICHFDAVCLHLPAVRAGVLSSTAGTAAPTRVVQFRFIDALKVYSTERFQDRYRPSLLIYFSCRKSTLVIELSINVP